MLTSVFLYIDSVCVLKVNLSGRKKVFKRTVNAELRKVLSVGPDSSVNFDELSTNAW